MLYKIKPLDFGGPADVIDKYFQTVRVPFGSYSISPIPYGNYFDKVPPEGFELRYCFDEYYDEGGIGTFKTIDEAKVKANEHWVSKLSECLESQTDVISITNSNYEDLIQSRDFLFALQSAGVDNWEGYEFAIDIMDGNA